MAKSILLSGYVLWSSIIDSMTLVVENIQFHEENLKNAMTPEFSATDKVYKQVMTGERFREAYKQVKMSL